jgi:hypothetical protein
MDALGTETKTPPAFWSGFWVGMLALSGIVLLAVASGSLKNVDTHLHWSK